jgi:SNF2 family DNA or RNA helicase
MVTAILKPKCLFCKKTADEVRRERYGNEVTIYLSCGHQKIEYSEESPREKYLELKSFVKGKSPFPYQADTAVFTEQSNFKTGIFHEQGLGKTTCSLLPVRLHADKLLPMAIFCKSSLKAQWLAEVFDWLHLPAQTIYGGKEKPYPELFKVFIISLNLLKNLDWIGKLNLQYVIIDECQLIKSSEAKRTQEVRKICANVPHVVALSGTPIKNHAAEYFPVLNILRPTLFHSKAAFELEYVDHYWNGYSMKYGGLKPSRADDFRMKTEDFIIRYMRDEVMPDLPKVFRQSRLCELGKEVAAAYRRTLEEFSDAYDEAEASTRNKFEENSNLMAILAKLRHLTGLAKIEKAVDYVADFLFECDRKIVLFYHHKDVGLALYTQLEQICHDGGFQKPAYLHTALSEDQETREDIRFKNDPACRVMIASTLKKLANV